MSTLGDSSEDQLISRITEKLVQRDDVRVGPGDDCAVVDLGNGQLQLLKTDCVVESVHFYPDEKPERVGWKAIARVVSDIAAMGGTPQAFVVTLVLRADTSLDWLDGLYTGMQKCAERFGVSIVGGETSSAPAGSANVISVAGTGHVEEKNLVLRSTAQVGDGVFVTGSLGGSIKGKHLDFTPRLSESQWLVKHFKLSAMMDLSDGLAKDLPRMAKLSKVGYQVDFQNVPTSAGCELSQALSDGEDYELLFTLPSSEEQSLLQSWPSDFPKLSKIGSIIVVEGQSSDLRGGWDHFKESKS